MTLEQLHARICACYGLANQIAMDLAPKSAADKASSKLHRATEDVCQLRESLFAVLESMRGTPDRADFHLDPKRFKGQSHESRIYQIVFGALVHHKRNWDYQLNRAKRTKHGHDD